MNNFGVKYVGKKNGNHLMSILVEYYTISRNWAGSWYLGMDIDWDYTNSEVHLSMLSYIRYAFRRFHQTCPQRLQDQPYPHVKPTYGAKAHYATYKDDSPVLLSSENKFIQELTGQFIY